MVLIRANATGLLLHAINKFVVILENGFKWLLKECVVLTKNKTN
jgi:hypothetical protein